MRHWGLVVGALWLAMSQVAEAQSVRSEVAASNGVTVTVYADEFANRYEYSAPIIELPNLGGFALVVSIRSNDRVAPARVDGSITYNGEWRRYDSAVFRGGAAVSYTPQGREVLSCRGSRYSGCALREGFSMVISRDDVTRYAEEGVLRVQVRSSTAADPVMFAIPVTYFAAVEEVAAQSPATLATNAAAPK